MTDHQPERLESYRELERRVQEAIAYVHRNGHTGVNETTQQHLAAVRRILEGEK